MAGRQPSRDERALWRHATRDVLPLADAAALPPEDGPPRPAETPAPPSPPRPAARRRAPTLPPLGADAAPGLDRRTAERLRRGELPIEARLDLHGMTQEEAHRALDDFLARAATAGQRCVLIITGKGRSRGAMAEAGGVLRAAVPRWLNEAPHRARLLAFAPARPQHGGGGALYLLLRRRR